jgi:hypothetical protein
LNSSKFWGTQNLFDPHPDPFSFITLSKLINYLLLCF